MQLLTLVLMSLGLLCMALGAVAQRWVLREQILNTKELRVIRFGVSAAFLLSYLFLWGELGPVWDNPKLFWTALAITLVPGVLIHFANAEAKALADVSLTAPYAAMTPGLITICALLFREVPSAQGLAGIALLSVGVWIHSSQEKVKGLSGLLEPIVWIFRVPSQYSEHSSFAEWERAQNNQRAVRWAVLSAMLGAIGLVGDGLLARSGSIALGLGIYCMVLTIVFAALPSSVGQDNKLALSAPLATRLKQHWAVTMLLGVLFAAHFLFVGMSYRMAPVAYIGSLKRLNILLVIVLAYFLLGEKKKSRLWPAMIITLGAVLLAFDPSVSRIMDAAEAWLTAN